MTPHSPFPDSDGFSPELLAAYADGELDAATRAAVERWLADHPEALVELSAQRELSPANVELWELAEPPEPSPDAWAATRRGIENELAAGRAARPWRWRAAGLFAACAAAVAGLVGVGLAVGWFRERPAPRPGALPAPEIARGRLPAPPAVSPEPRAVSPARDPLAEFAVLPMATDDDVVLYRVPDTGTGWLPVGRHPLPDVLVLASEDEVSLQEVEPSPAWPTGGPKMTIAPGDAPMIFAAKRR